MATNTIRHGLTRALIEEGHDILILTTGTSEELNEAKQQGLKVIDVGAGNDKVLASVFYFRKLLLVLRKQQPDIVLTFTIRPNIWGNLAARLLRLPVISSVTGIGPLFSVNTISFKIARRLYQIALAKTKWIFFQNEDDKHLFVRKGLANADRVQVVAGSGVDTSFFQLTDLPVNEKFTFLFIGRLIRDKGIEEYIAAAKRLKLAGLDVTCKVLGPFWSQNFKANIITHDQLNTWIHDGLIVYEGEAKDVRPYIASADCIVLPSYREGLSNVLLEAGSMGRPSIASNVTGCREIVADGITGLLCSPQNVDELSSKMTEMSQLPMEARRAMALAARKRMEDVFEKKIVINAYLQALRRVKDKFFAANC